MADNTQGLEEEGRNAVLSLITKSAEKVAEQYPYQTNLVRDLAEAYAFVTGNANPSTVQKVKGKLSS